MKYFEYVVIGAGPAGLQMGYYLENTKKNYIIIERNQVPGSFYGRYPRNRMLISINKYFTGKKHPDFNLRHDWNSLLTDYHKDHLLFKNYSKAYYPSADSLLEYLKEYASMYNLKINYKTQVINISKKNKRFVIKTNKDIFVCKYLLIGTGLSKENVPDYKGKELITTYGKMSMDKNKYKNKNVYIIGLGNSGLETANHLLDSTSSIHLGHNDSKFAWETHYPGHIRSVNAGYIDSYLLKSQNVISKMPKQVRLELVKENGKINVSMPCMCDNHTKEPILGKKYDYVISCTGFKFDESIFDDTARPNFNGKLPEMDYDFSSKNIKNMYFIGALMQYTDFKKCSGAFIHGFRYYIRTLFRILEYRNHNIMWPNKKINKNLNELVQYMFHRINTTSGLYQNFGYLCDIIRIDKDGFTYFYELPYKYHRRFKEIKNSKYLVLTLEYGKSFTHDILNPVLTFNPNEAEKSTFLHPIIRYMDKEGEVDMVHIVEDVNAEWYSKKLHHEPLKEFLNRCIKKREGFSVNESTMKYVILIILIYYGTKTIKNIFKRK